MSNLSFQPIVWISRRSNPKLGQPNAIRFSGDNSIPPPHQVVVPREQLQVTAQSLLRLSDHLLGSAMQDNQDVQNDAADALEGAIRLYEMSYDTLSPDLAKAHKQLGVIRIKQGHFTAAEKHLKEARRILESHNRNHPDLAEILKQLVKVYKVTGRQQDAQSTQTLADKIQGTSSLPDKLF